MKEFPKFEYEGISYDLNFYDDTVNLYAVQNALSGMMISQLIPAANDYVALTGFKNFLEKQKENNDTEIYQLILVGTLNIQKIKIVDDTRQIIFDSRNDLDKWLEDAKNFMLSCNNEDD